VKSSVGPPDEPQTRRDHRRHIETTDPPERSKKAFSYLIGLQFVPAIEEDVKR
jgi:hypothetical protein